MNKNSKTHKDSNNINKSESVIVVGGGIIGIACAHYLTQMGHQVTVIDQGKLGGGSSSGNCGYICPSHVLPLAEPGMITTGIKSLFDKNAAFKIKPQLRFGLFRWLYKFARQCSHTKMLHAGHHLKNILDYSRHEYELLFTHSDINSQWRKNGLLYVLKSELGLETFSKTDQLLSDEFGLKAKFIRGSDLPNFDKALKNGLSGGYLYENDASLEPGQLIANWSRYLLDKGVKFIENCQLNKVFTKHQKIEALLTSENKLKADQFVFATGAWSAQLSSGLNCQIPVEPCKGYSVTIDRPSLSPKTPMLFPEHRVGITPFHNSFRLGSMMEFSGLDTSIESSRIEQLYQSADPYLKTTFDTSDEQIWSGLRPMTWDSLPIIGPVPKIKNAILATGHNMLGMTLAPATGKLVAAMLSGQQPDIDPNPYSPTRFN